jgi:hypothetical protein
MSTTCFSRFSRRRTGNRAQHALRCQPPSQWRKPGEKKPGELLVEIESRGLRTDALDWADPNIADPTAICISGQWYGPAAPSRRGQLRDRFTTHNTLKPRREKPIRVADDRRSVLNRVPAPAVGIRHPVAASERDLRPQTTPGGSNRPAYPPKYLARFGWR